MRIGTRHIATDRRFLGSMIGDHTKTAIGTRLMTGTYIGYCSLLAASGLPPRFIPEFYILDGQGHGILSPGKGARSHIAGVRPAWAGLGPG